MKVCHFRDDFSNAFVTKRQTDRLRREAFGVGRIPALCESSARREAKAPEYGALQTLRAIWLRLGRAEDPARRDALPPSVTGLPGLLACSLWPWQTSRIMLPTIRPLHEQQAELS